MTIDVTQLIIALLGIIITTFIVPWLSKKKNREAVETAIQVTTTIVKAAWELDVTGELAKLGQDKVTYAWEQAKAALLAKGIKIDDDELKAYIKGAVAQLRIDRGDDVKT